MNATLPALSREQAYALCAKANVCLVTLLTAYRQGAAPRKRSAPRERALAVLLEAGLLTPASPPQTDAAAG